MTAHVATVSFQGIEVLPIDVQCQLGNGLPAMNVVGLADKAVAESRERVRAAFHALGLALPPKRITLNLAPADVQKEGSHYDLPIAVALLVAMDVLPAEEMQEFLVLGELSLDGRLAPVSGVLAAAMAAVGSDRGLICPAAQGGEAAWAGGTVLAPPTLLALINHIKGQQKLPVPEPGLAEDEAAAPDLAEVKGQESAKRALEIAAAAGHNLLMSGPPGSGKSMLAARLPGLLPPLSPREALEVSTIHSLAGMLAEGRLLRRRPYRAPHHGSSMAALVGGGQKARPGEVSLAHRGVLFLDELPEFQRASLEALRQPLESGQVTIARANAHVTYPARIQLIAAMNPCKCGYFGEPAQACTRAPRCAADYQARLSGPLLDRIDLHVSLRAVSPVDLVRAPAGETSAVVAARIATARAIQAERLQALAPGTALTLNAEVDGRLLERLTPTDAPAARLLGEAAERLRLSARGYHRVLRVARTLADLAGRDTIGRVEIAEALQYRYLPPAAPQTVRPATSS